MANERVILIDNATLSGVERLIGQSAIINLNNIDHDIICFEKFIISILFSDRIAALDDYKVKYRSDRMRRFSFIEFLTMDPTRYQSLARDAACFAQEGLFAFEGSKPAGDVVAFFESLRINPQLRWNVFGSSEYLTLSLLVGSKNTEYEEAVDSMLGHELADSQVVTAGKEYEPRISVAGRTDIQNIKDLVRELAAENPNFVSGSSQSLLQRAVFGYGWAAERTHFYSAVAAIEGAEPCLAPLRDAFCESCCRLESKTQVTSLIDHLKNNTKEVLSRIVEVSGRSKFVIKTPLFASYLISKCDSPIQCIEMALELRKSAEFVDCRSILINLSHLSTHDRYNEVNRILNLLEHNSNKLLKKYGVTTQNGLSASFSFGLTGPSLGVSLKLDRLFVAYRNKPFSRMFRNISNDLLSIERLGGLYEKLTVLLRKDKDANHRRISTTPKFMEKKESEFGRPAQLED